MNTYPDLIAEPAAVPVLPGPEQPLSPDARQTKIPDTFSGPGRLTDLVATRNDPLGRAIRECLDRYEAQAFAAGIRLELQTDFHHLAEINPHLEKAPLTPQFDPEISDIGPVNGFWLKGVDTRGEVVQTQAVRLDNLDGTSLALHLKSLKAFYRNPAESAHARETCTVEAPAAYGITGRVGYHGEFWVKGGRSGYRGHDLAVVLPRIGMALALARWSPDFMYGTIQPAIAEKGIVARYGYHNLQPHGIIWTLPQSDQVLDEWLMWMSWRDMVDLIERS